MSLSGGREMRNGRERMANVSTRAVTANDARVLTAGFVIAGTQPLPVLIRAVGPTLGQFGVGNTLANARLEVFRNTTSVTTNAEWSTSIDAPRVTTAAQHVGAFALPVGSKDAAVLLSLAPGDYTATVTGGNGVALVEVYDASEGSNGAARLVNLATRAQVGSGNDALAAGFVVAGPERKRMLIRGIGPGLAQFGVAGMLADPTLQLFSGSTPRATNDNWSRGRWSRGPRGGGRTRRSVSTGCRQQGCRAPPLISNQARIRSMSPARAALPGWRWWRSTRC